MTRRKRILLGSLLFAVFVASLLSSVSSWPATCSACHSPFATDSAASAHSGVHCYSCHAADDSWSVAAAKAAELTRMLPRGLLGGGPRGPAVRTSREACLDCHEGVLKGVSGNGGLRVRHASCAPGASCDGCHSTIAHGDAVRWVSAPVMEDCVACHAEKGAPAGCETCHDGKQTERRIAAGPWQVTHGPRWQDTHGMGRLDSCGTCHPDDYCVDCHGTRIPHGLEFGGSHGREAKADPDACLVCHDRETFCRGCHGLEMPHPVGFKQEHPTLAEGTEDPSCTKCHAEGDCERCHEYHVHPGGSKGVPVPWTLTSGDRR